MFGYNITVGIDDKAINERVSKLLAYVQRTQDVHRKDALQRYIQESLYRIARVYKISGESYAYQFISQVEESLGLGYSKGNTVVSDLFLYREFVNHKFKKQSNSSAVIDNDDFRAFMQDKVPLLSAKGKIAEAESIEYGEQCFDNRKVALLNKQNSYVGVALGKYIQSKLTALDGACKKISVEPSERIDIKIAFINKLERVGFTSAYTRTGYINTGNVQKFQRKSNGYDVDYDDFEKKVSQTISFHSPGGFISDALKLSERKSHLLKSVRKIKDSVLDGYSNQNKKDILDAFEGEMNKLEATISNAKSDFFAVATEAKDKVSAMLLNMRKSEENYYNNNITLFKGHRHANSSLQPRIDTANKIFASEVLSVLDQKEYIKKTMTEVKAIIDSYSGTSKNYIVQDFKQKVAQLESQIFGNANQNNIDADAVTNLKSGMTKLLKDLKLQDHNHYNGKSFFQEYQRSNSSFQPKLKAAIDIIDNIQIAANTATVIRMK